MVRLASEGFSRWQEMAPTEHRLTYETQLVVATRFLSAVNYGGNDALPIFPRHPASSSSSASTGRSYQAPSSFSRPPFPADTFPSSSGMRHPHMFTVPPVFVARPSPLGGGKSTSVHFKHYTMLLYSHIIVQNFLTARPPIFHMRPGPSAAQTALAAAAHVPSAPFQPGNDHYSISFSKI